MRELALFSSMFQPSRFKARTEHRAQESCVSSSLSSSVPCAELERLVKDIIDI